MSTIVEYDGSMTTARSRNATETRASILAAARIRFAAGGFDRTTIRSVATDAAVDPALVMHYFGNKAGLFAAAAELTLRLPDLSDVPPDRWADALVPVFIEVWNPDGPFLGLVRAAASNPVAATALLTVFTDQVAPTLARVALDRPMQRAALVGSTMLGIAVFRYIIAAPPLVAMADDELARWLRPVITHYLTDPLP